MSGNGQVNMVKDESILKLNNAPFSQLIMNLLYGLCIFAVSFRILIAAAILMGICAVIILVSLRAKVCTFLFMGGVLVFFLFYYILGLPHYERGTEKFTNAFCLLLTAFVFFYSLGYKESKRNSVKWLNFFALSSISYVVIVCTYSLMKGYPGYNLVYDPINMSEENSPLYALQLVLFSVTYINFNWIRKRIIFNTIFLLATICFSVIYLGSRAAFFILVFFFIFKLFFNKKNIKIILILSFIIVPVILTFIGDLNIGELGRFGGFSDRGLDSPRFNMFVYGFENFTDYPYGGMQVVAEGYTGIWFHNMMLDLVRVSGFYVMYMWLAILIITSIFLFNKKNKCYMILFAVLNIALMQDLAFDGFFNIMALEFYLIGASLYKESKENV